MDTGPWTYKIFRIGPNWHRWAHVEKCISTSKQPPPFICDEEMKFLIDWKAEERVKTLTLSKHARHVEMARHLKELYFYPLDQTIVMRDIGDANGSEVQPVFDMFFQTLKKHGLTEGHTFYGCIEDVPEQENQRCIKAWEGDDYGI